MQLVVRHSSVSTSGIDDSDKTIKTQIHILETEISELNDNIAEANDAIKTFQSKMVEEHTDLVAQSRRLEALILDLEQDFLELSRTNTNVDQDDELDALADSEEEQTQTETQETLRKMCKKLYRKLAMLTHPDRTKNKRRRELFKEAKEAYRNLDLEKLMDIRDELDAGLEDDVEMSGLLSRMLERLNNLNAQATQLRFQWKALSTSDDYTLAMLYEVTPEITSDNFRLYMLQQIEMLRMKYDFMKSTYDLQSKT